MTVYLYTGVYSIPPGKNIALFPGVLLYNKIAMDGSATKAYWSNSTVNNTQLTHNKVKVQSAKASSARVVDITLVDEAGNSVPMQFETKGCGKSAVFGHHRRLTLELLDYPRGNNKGTARSYITQQPVPLKGRQLTEGLEKLVSEWICDLMDDTGAVFLNYNRVLDVMAREYAIDCCKVQGKIPVNWNPLGDMSSLPSEIPYWRDKLTEGSSSYRLSSYCETIIKHLSDPLAEPVSLKQLVDCGLLPCYPVFNVSPYGPRVWDEDRQVKFVGVYQKGGYHANRNNYNLCRKLAELTGTPCTTEELSKAVDRPEVNGVRGSGVFEKVQIQGVSLYFLGVTDSKTRKETK